jgi:hypothetical protein
VRKGLSGLFGIKDLDPLGTTCGQKLPITSHEKNLNVFVSQHQAACHLHGIRSPQWMTAAQGWDLSENLLRKGNLEESVPIRFEPLAQEPVFFRSEKPFTQPPREGGMGLSISQGGNRHDSILNVALEGFGSVFGDVELDEGASVKKGDHRRSSITICAADLPLEGT